MRKQITITAPQCYPGAFMLANNYRSPHGGWVLVFVRSVKTEWDNDSNVTHGYYTVRVNSLDERDYYRGGKKQQMVFLYVGEDGIKPLEQ